MIMEIAIKIIMIKMTTMGSSFQLFSGTIGIWSVGFCGWSKTGGPGEKSGKTEQRGDNKINPHVTPGLVIRCSLRYAIPSSQLVWFVRFFFMKTKKKVYVQT